MEETEDNFVPYRWQLLNLYDSWDYQYTTAIGNETLIIRIYYTPRTKQWSMDVLLSEGQPLIEGELLSPLKPTIADRVPEIPGFFWLEPIAHDDNQTYLHPELLSKYFNLYYVELI